MASSRTVTVNYGTSPEATALQWMKKEQTADKKAPYLFSQCQAIHARSIVPCMDTPSVKTTYEAEVGTLSGRVAPLDPGSRPRGSDLPHVGHRRRLQVGRRLHDVLLQAAGGRALVPDRHRGRPSREEGHKRQVTVSSSFRRRVHVTGSLLAT